MSDLGKLAGRTLEIYERNAARYDRERGRSLFEKGWLDRFAAMVPAGGRILDVGCGTGAPIGDYLAGSGHPVTGVDGAAAMIAIARDRRPERDWQLGDMRALEMGERFDGVLAWDSFFHLTGDEQREVLPRLLRHVRTGGPLMLTVGPAAGEVTGHVADDVVYHASLSPEEYRRIIEACGAEVAAFAVEDPACDGHTVLLARAG
ncbi:MAG: class I SAM-dependent methyltransferase [Roseovarius indicus]